MEFDPFYVEQPLELDDLEGHALLRKMQSVPIALDESAYTLNDVGNFTDRAEAMMDAEQKRLTKLMHDVGVEPE